MKPNNHEIPITILVPNNNYCHHVLINYSRLAFDELLLLNSSEFILV